MKSINVSNKNQFGKNWIFLFLNIDKSTTFFFVFFSIANLGFPGMSSFTGEFLTLIGCFQSNFMLTFFLSIGMILGAAYSLWVCNRILFGSLNTRYIAQYNDVNRRECAVLFPLIICTLWMGLYPEIFLECMHTSVCNLMQKI